MKEIRRSRLHALLTGPRFGGDRSKFCAEADITNGRLSQLLDPKEPFGDVAAKNLAEKLALPEGYFDRDEGSTGFGRPKSGSLSAIALDDNPDYPAVRRVAIKAQAGVSGYAVEYMHDDGPPIVFRADWYKAKGFRPEKMLAVRITGDSMIPNLYEGDLIVINTAQTDAKDGLAFVASYEGEIVVKRLVRDAGSWWLTSDNPDQRRYPRKVCDEHTQIIGEVVYRQTERV